MTIAFEHDDGGREAAGYKGTAGDCGCRAISIVTGLPYQRVYDEINEQAKRERRKKGRSSARSGVHRRTFEWVLEALVPGRWTWTPTMFVGQGCKVHVRDGEVPREGRHILNLSGHYSALVEGTVRDNHNPSRGGTRCVYGYWTIN